MKKEMKLKTGLIGGMVFAVFLSACNLGDPNGNGNGDEDPSGTREENSISVTNQAVVDDEVTIDEAYISENGWLDIHADANGSPGPVIGHSALDKGENTDVTVTIDVSEATPKLYAMLHVDAGEEGVYEYPGADGPLMVEGETITESFQVTGLENGNDNDDDDIDDAMDDDAADLPTQMNVSMADFAFKSSSVTIARGGRVTWTNNDSVAHTATGTGFDSGNLNQGESFSYTFNTAGTYNYICSLHPSMKGTIVVK